MKEMKVFFQICEISEFGVSTIKTKSGEMKGWDIIGPVWRNGADLLNEF